MCVWDAVIYGAHARGIIKKYKRSHHKTPDSTLWTNSIHTMCIREACHSRFGKWESALRQNQFYSNKKINKGKIKKNTAIDYLFGNAATLQLNLRLYCLYSPIHKEMTRWIDSEFVNQTQLTNKLDLNKLTFFYFFIFKKYFIKKNHLI